MVSRVIDEGGWYFHIANMTTLPAHQCLDWGQQILRHLLDVIRDRAPGQSLRHRGRGSAGSATLREHGVTDSAPARQGRALVLTD